MTGYLRRLSKCRSSDSIKEPHEYKSRGTDEAIPLTGREGPYGYEMTRPPNFLDTRLTDGGEVLNLMRRQPFIPRKIPGTHFC
jgi:hypothetical protein